MRKLAPLLALALLLLPPSPPRAGGAAVPRLWQLSTGLTLPLPAALPALAAAPVVLLGERHTEAAHHRMQLAVIRALHEEAGLQLAIGVEMVRRRNQPALDRWIAGEMGEEEFSRVFASDWGETWPHYREIFLYARERRIPMLALNIPAGITGKIASRGYSSLTPEELAEIRGASCEVDGRYRDYIRRALGRRGSEEQFQRFCEAQMVWDTTMAWRVARFREEAPGRRVVVLAGLAHAWRHGIPARIPTAPGEARPVTVLPAIPGFSDPGTMTAEDADYLWLEGG